MPRLDIADRSIAATSVRWTGTGPMRRDSVPYLTVEPWTGDAPLVMVDTPPDAHCWVRLEIAPHDARRLAAALLEAANLSEPEADRCPWSVSYLPGDE